MKKFSLFIFIIALIFLTSCATTDYGGQTKTFRIYINEHDSIERNFEACKLDEEFKHSSLISSYTVIYIVCGTYNPYSTVGHEQFKIQGIGFEEVIVEEH